MTRFDTKIHKSTKLETCHVINASFIKLDPTIEKIHVTMARMGEGSGIERKVEIRFEEQRWVSVLISWGPFKARRTRAEEENLDLAGLSSILPWKHIVQFGVNQSLWVIRDYSLRIRFQRVPLTFHFDRLNCRSSWIIRTFLKFNSINSIVSKIL